MKRDIAWRRRSKLNRKLAKYPLIQTINPDPQFDWTSTISKVKNAGTDGFSFHNIISSKGRAQRVIPINMKMVSKLGIMVLPDRRLCFGGKTLDGIILPKSKNLQNTLILRFLIWYLPCVEFEHKVYTFNKSCQKRMEIRFLSMYLISLGYYHNVRT